MAASSQWAIDKLSADITMLHARLTAKEEEHGRAVQLMRVKYENSLESKEDEIQGLRAAFEKSGSKHRDREQSLLDELRGIKDRRAGELQETVNAQLEVRPLCGRLALCLYLAVFCSHAFL